MAKPSTNIANWILKAASSLASLVIIGSLLFIVFDILRNGYSSLSLDFFLSEPENSGRAGGIGPILVSTIAVVGIALLVSIPIGLGTAIWLSEFTKDRSPKSQLVRKSLDVLAGVPSIVFGLFGNALFCVYLGMGFSILSGGLTLACMVLPILIRVSEEALSGVPDEYRKSAAALGYSHTATLFFILIPVALPSLLAGVLLGFGRAIAETAALIFTSGYVDRWPESLMDSGRTLSVHIYDLAMNVPGGDHQAYATSLSLVLILLAAGGLSALLVGFHLKRKGLVYE